MATLNYYTFVQRFAEQTGTLKADSNPTLIVPSAIDYAEQRIYRELDILGTVVTASSFVTSSGNRTFNFNVSLSGNYQSADFIVLEQLNIITPAGTIPGSSTGNAGTRVPCIPVTREFIDAAFPTALSSLCATPEYFAMRDNVSVLLGPTPDAAYTVEVRGVVHQTPLSQSNSSTILTQYVPDLFLAAAMVYAAEYLKKGADPTNKNLSQSWEMQYQSLMRTALVEQFRAKFQSEGWNTKHPNPIATPKRV